MSKANFNYGYIWVIAMVAAIGGFLFGYDWVLVGGAKNFYEPYFELTTPAQKGWGTSSAMIGCMIGALLAFLRSDLWGRRRFLIFAGFLFSLSAIGTAVVNQFVWYNTFRIIGGMGIGIALNLSPVYISEMSPSHMRGKLVTVNQLLINIGVLSAQLVNYLIASSDTGLASDPTAEMIRQSWSGQMGWRWMFAAEAVPAFLFFILMIFMPESVRWLVKNGQYDKAEKILGKIGGKEHARKEISEIKETISKEETGKLHYKDLLEPRLIKIILLGFFLVLLQQWSGLNVVFYYAADIFKAAGYNIQQMMLNIVVIGGVMVLAVLLTVFIVDTVGRKKLMLFGTGSIAITYGIIGYMFLVGVQGAPIVIFTLLNVALYSLTLAPIMWVILSEIFPNRIRGTAMSLTAIMIWVGNFSLTFSFPTIKENLGWAKNFWLYGLICLVGFVVLYFVLTETKNKSLEQIEKELVGEKKKT